MAPVFNSSSRYAWIRRRLAAAPRALAPRLGFETLLVILLAATLVSIAGQGRILRKTIGFGPESAAAYPAYVYGDEQSGGNSTARVDPERPLHWSCALGSRYLYPYCGYELSFDAQREEKGRDWSDFQTLTIDLDYRGTARSLRLNLENFDPRYATRGKPETYKVNSVEFPVRQGSQTVRIDLSTLTVADWWIAEENIPPELKDVEIDNVISLGIETGSSVKASRHVFAIRRVELVGAKLAPEQFYLALLVSWLALIAGYVGWRMYRLRRNLEESEAVKSGIVDASPDWVSLLDLDGTVLYVNKGPVEALGVDRDALLGQRWGSGLPQEALLERDVAIATAQRGGVGRLSVSMAGRAGTTLWVESLIAPLRNPAGEIIRLVVMTRDVTHQKSVEEQVRWSAAHDMLTGLPNRRLFQERLEQQIGSGPPAFGLLLLDIDDFKQVNDSLGHDAGDHLLRITAERLSEALRPGDFAARLGGDEFAVIVQDVATEKTLEAAAEALLRRLEGSWLHEGRICDLRVSIGSSLFGRHGRDASQLLKNADIALYTAKGGGRGRVAVFASKMRAASEKQAAMLSLARRAVTDDLIVPYYQPVVEIASGRVVGFEALLRWRHPTRGIQQPASIAASFEDLEIASEITGRMIERAARDAGDWIARGVAFGHVAINAAAADFHRGDFPDRLLAALERNKVPTGRFHVEVTETVFLGRGASYVERALQTLSRAGIKVALDDFGTGYASLSHLKQFPVDIIKIDRSFVSNLERDGDDAAIIRAVVSLGRSLNLAVVAEGIEMPAQEAYLLGEGCTYGQGFLYGKAAPASRVPGILAGKRPLLSIAA